MRPTHCHWPSWSATGKLIKKGSYCNWESVVAHMAHQLENSTIDVSEHEKAAGYAQGITSSPVHAAPHYEELQHTKGCMSAEEFHERYMTQVHAITAVKIAPNSEVSELPMQPDKHFYFGDYPEPPYTPLPHLHASMFPDHFPVPTASRNAFARLVYGQIPAAALKSEAATFPP